MGVSWGVCVIGVGGWCEVSWEVGLWWVVLVKVVGWSLGGGVFYLRVVLVEGGGVGGVFGVVVEVGWWWWWWGLLFLEELVEMLVENLVEEFEMKEDELWYDY